MKSALPMLLAPALAVSAVEPLSRVLVVGVYDDSFSGDSAGYESASAFTFKLDTVPELLTKSAVGLNPSWMIAAPGAATGNTTSLFAQSESQLYAGRSEGSVASLELGCDGSIAVTSRHGSGGGAPVYLSSDPTGKYVLVPNYGGGNVAVFPVQDGASGPTLGPAHQVMEFGDQAKAHSAVFGPSANALFVPTLGLDVVQQLTFSEGQFSQNGPPLTVPEHEGPRHIAFHPHLDIAILLNEGSADAECTVVLCEFDGAAGRLAEIATYDTLPSGTGSSNMYPSEVQFTKDGSYVLISNRDATDEKKDGISVFKVHEKELTFLQYAPVGHYPRSMVLTDDGLVITGNQKDNSLSILRFESGSLTKIDEDVPVGQSPAFVGVFDLPSACSASVVV